MGRLKIGIVGCGAIGGSLAEYIAVHLKDEAILVALYDIDILKARRLSQAVNKKSNLSVNSLGALVVKSSLVIEAASAAVSWEIAKSALSKGRDIMLMSTGGLIKHYRQLRALAKKHHARVYIPSGAISGIDALKAAKIGRIRKVTLVTRKNPSSFKGVKYIQDKGIELDKIKKDKILFSGKAAQAVKYFPQNINVAAVLSLAGIGEDKTCVKIIASASTRNNIHEVQIESRAGRVTTRTENLLHPDNPKTSFLAVLSAAATLKQILEPVRIGT